MSSIYAFEAKKKNLIFLPVQFGISIERTKHIAQPESHYIHVQSVPTFHESASDEMRRRNSDLFHF